MITDESIERVREAADIVEIVGEHVKLKRSGSSFRGPCPFHHGTGPNFSVTPRTNSYYCFVCHAKGDVIGFVRDHLGMDFVDAVKYIADRAGVDGIGFVHRYDRQGLLAAIAARVSPSRIAA